jgi:hypothetical protein
VISQTCLISLTTVLLAAAATAGLQAALGLPGTLLAIITMQPGGSAAPSAPRQPGRPHDPGTAGTRRSAESDHRHGRLGEPWSGRAELVVRALTRACSAHFLRVPNRRSVGCSASQEGLSNEANVGGHNTN